ncbi:hypothetical protein Gotur_025320 [Gossypium turneri]
MEGDLLRLPLPECWVVSTLHMLIDAVTESYNKLFFGDVGRELYDFFWGGFADWYIEASKARLYHSGDDSIALVAQTIILYVFENILKLITSIHAIRNWGTVAGVGFVVHPLRFSADVTVNVSFCFIYLQALPNRREALIISLVIFSALAKLHIVLG